MASPIRVVIAEDSVILRDGLVQLLESRGFVVADAVGEVEPFLLAVEREDPDVAIVDIRMPPTLSDEGVRAAIALRKKFPNLGVLVFSQYVETRFATQLLAGGANGVGYLLKDRVADVTDFVDALKRVASGGTALDPEVVTQLMGISRQAETIAVLTLREKEVLELMAQGRSNRAIAADLVVSEGAIEKHVASIFMKFELPVSPDDNRRILAVLRYLEE